MDAAGDRRGGRTVSPEPGSTWLTASHRWAVGLGLAAFLATGRPALAAAPLPPAKGDFSLFALALSEPAGDGRSRLTLVLEFPAVEIGWRARGDSLVASLDCRWSLHALGREAAAVAEAIEFARSAETELASLVYLRAVELPPGEYRLEIDCRDRQRREGGLAGLFASQPTATLSATLAVRDFSGGGLGDLQLFRLTPAGDMASPNPSGLYAAGEGALELATAFAPPPDAPAGHLALTLTVRDAAGALRLEKRGGWKYEAGELLPLRYRLPLADLPAGDYRLQLAARSPGLDSLAVDCPLRIRGGGAPSAEALARRAVEAQLFLEGDAFAGWQRLPAGEQIAQLDAFWRAQDPDPATEANEVYDEFLARYRAAQARYGGFGPGALSDRGRILIRLGEPASIEGEAVPLNRTGLSNAVRGLHGESEVEPGISGFGDDPGQGAGLQRGSDLARDLSAIGTGGAVNFGDDSEAYEVWTYEFGGAPLLPPQRLHLRRPSLQLIFVDRSGTGDYTLVYRSEDFDF